MNCNKCNVERQIVTNNLRLTERVNGDSIRLHSATIVKTSNIAQSLAPSRLNFIAFRCLLELGISVKSVLSDTSS